MAEAIVAVILQQIVTITSEEARQSVRLVKGVEGEIEIMKQHLEAIQVVLEDAEEKQMSDRRIKLWLDWLKEAAHDLADVLDEWNTALLKLKMDGVGITSSKGKVCSFFHSCFHPQVVWRHDVAAKIKSISERLDQIARKKDMYGLLGRPGKEFSGRVQTSSFDVDVSQLHGRDEIKEDIIDSVLSGTGTGTSRDEIKTISLVGMGGVGKTALAQFVYHDSRIDEHFRRIWVCVSDVFDEKNVAKSIILGLEGVRHDRLIDSLPMEQLLQRIEGSIKGLKFFLVLDDVWADNRQNWERLLRILGHGASGSTILLTTRKDTVANMMEYSHVFHLSKLSEHDCWMVLSQLAFAGRSDEERRKVEDVGRKISDRCKGLPLAAKTLGCLLRSKSSRAEWESILHSKLWKLDIAQRDIFAPLLLSYCDLPMPIRQCFKYCAIFPKDYEYWQHHITYHWIAQGYLGPVNGDQELKLKGREYVEFLKARSFFQDFTRESDGLLCRWKMHDIVHDFAHFLMGENESMIYEVNSGSSNSMIDLSASKTRYLTALIEGGSCLPSTIYGAQKLCSFVSMSTSPDAITGKVLRIVFNQAKLLRVVDLRKSLRDTVPKEVGNLIHLRHINLNKSVGIKRLPESLCNLINLQYLDLNWCSSLEKLPDGIGKLINLMFLRTYNCHALSIYPKSIGRLTNLRELIGVKLVTDRNDSKELSLGDLENMSHLIDLCINLQGNARIDAGEVSRVKFDNKTQLRRVQVYSYTETMRAEYITAAFNLSSGIMKFGFNGSWSPV